MKSHMLPMHKPLTISSRPKYWELGVCVHTPNSSSRSWHVEYDYGLQSTSRCTWPMVSSPYSTYSIYGAYHQRRSEAQNRSVTWVIVKRWLHLFGHLVRADPSQDHSRILRAAINRPPADWRRRAGRPRRTWLRTIELDLLLHNLGLNTAWMRAQDRSK